MVYKGGWILSATALASMLTPRLSGHSLKRQIFKQHNFSDWCGPSPE